MTREYGSACQGSGFRLSSDHLPYVGNYGYRFRVTGAPGVLPVAFLAFGDQVFHAGVDLASFGMGGCLAYTNGNLGLFDMPLSLPFGDGIVPFAIPNDPSIAGAGYAMQALAFGGATPLGLTTSNGHEFRVGF